MEGYEDKSPLGETRMGNVKFEFVQNEGAEHQDIEVDGARAVEKAGGAVAAELALDAEKGRQEGGGGKVCFEGDDGVDETRLVVDSDGRGGIEGRPAGDAADGAEALGGSHERGDRRTDGAGNVGAHPDVSSLHEFKGSAAGAGAEGLWDYQLL
jgi:hypothetical protein